MDERRTAEGVEHLQAAARELLGAARAFLDVVEDVVEDSDRLNGAAAAIGDLVKGFTGRGPQPWQDAAWADETDSTDDRVATSTAWWDEPFDAGDEAVPAEAPVEGAPEDGASPDESTGDAAPTEDTGATAPARKRPARKKAPAKKAPAKRAAARKAPSRKAPAGTTPATAGVEPAAAEPAAEEDSTPEAAAAPAPGDAPAGDEAPRRTTSRVRRIAVD